MQKQLDAANDGLLHAQAKVLEEEKKHGSDRTRVVADSGRDRLEAEQRVNDAQADLDRANTQLRFAQGQASINEAMEADKVANEKKYQNHLSYLTSLLALESKDPTKNKSEILRINGEVEALEKEHSAKLIENEANLQKTLKTLRSNPVETQQSDVNELIPFDDTQKALNDLETMLSQYGITSETVWIRQAQDAASAFTKIKNSGMATYSEILQMQEKLANANLSLAMAQGDTAAMEQYRKEIQACEAELNKLDNVVEKSHKVSKDWVQQWKQGGLDVQQALGTLEDIGTNALNKFGGALENGIEAWINGQESLGQALEKATEETLASVAAQAAVYALFYTAYGSAQLAMFNFDAAADAFAGAAIFASVAVLAGASAYGMNAAAGGSGGSSGSGSSSSSSPAASGNGITGSSSTAGTNPTQTTNVHRFAAGGLISQPTLAVIGDSISSASQGAREGVLPLDDPKAMDAIAEAITARMGGRGGGDSHFHFPNLRGVVSSDVLDDVIDQVNTRVQGGKRLLATESRRVVRRVR